MSILSLLRRQYSRPVGLSRSSFWIKNQLCSLASLSVYPTLLHKHPHKNQDGGGDHNASPSQASLLASYPSSSPSSSNAESFSVTKHISALTSRQGRMLHSLSISSPSIHQYQYQHQQQQQYQQQQQPRHSLLSALLHQPLHRRELSCYHRFFHLSHDHRFHYTTTTDSKDKESSGSVEQGISESRNQDHNINGGQHNQEGVKSESHNSNDDSDTNDSTHINMNDGKNDGHEEDTHAGGENRTESILDALLLVVHFWVIITLFRRYVADISMCLGPSMLPTINRSGDIILLSKMSDFGRGDVVVSKSFNSEAKSVCKRIIGMPGDVVYVKGRGEVKAIRVAKDYVWIQGDNLDNSLDSRKYGAVPVVMIDGKATHRIWPYDQMSSLHSTMQYSNQEQLAAVYERQSKREGALRVVNRMSLRDGVMR